LQGNSSSGSSGGGGLGCNWCTVSVLSLAWNDKDQILYIGGKFNMVDRYSTVYWYLYILYVYICFVYLLLGFVLVMASRLHTTHERYIVAANTTLQSTLYAVHSGMPVLVLLV
jgi:hypothetical protein